MKYEVIIYWSKDDNAFIAEVPELAGCMADGASDVCLIVAGDPTPETHDPRNSLGILIVFDFLPLATMRVRDNWSRTRVVSKSCANC